MNRKYYVYILTNKNNSVIYTGMTNNLNRRLIEHTNGLINGFTKDYKVIKLVHFEEFSYVNDAIKREKQIKSWSRQKKIELIKENNENWSDLTK
ncbi:GIY-YIG nuclease family protein [candidate division KSB1 bacterium]